MTPRPALSHLRHRLTAAGAAFLTASVASACTVTSPVQTDAYYDPADGVSVETGTLEVLDLLVVSEGHGGRGVVSGYVVNTGREPVTVDVQLETEGGRTPLSPSVEVAPGTGVRLDGGMTSDTESGEPMHVPEVTPRAGELLTLRVSSSAGDTTSTRVPILLPEGPYEPYAEVLAAGE